MPESFRYILRYQIDPDREPEQRLEELLQLCRTGRIEEVMLFFTAEELSTGHLTREEMEKYGRLACRVRDRLAEAGIAMSLNPWSTMYHLSRGRVLGAGQNFRTVVGETGAVSSIVACPLCPEWQEYLCDYFAWMAREIRPLAIWVEDDLRLHNHEDDQGWGGCFCEEHMRLFSQRVGQTVTRQELLSRILAPGEPHPWRKTWLELSRESLLQPARRLREVIEAAAPGVRLGLMTSVPDVHSAEGRDWAALQEALGERPAFLVRPHIDPYTETTAIGAPPTMTRHTLANLHGAVEAYPELENSPRCGQYSKSAAFSLWECFCAAVYGSRGITINHFDMMGNGVALDRRFAPALGAAKDQLNALAALGLDDRQAEGVRVLFHPEVAAVRHSTDTSSMRGLCETSQIWAKTLSILGIAHRFTSKIEAGQAYAVNGQTLRAFSDEEIERLLSEAVLLDALSVEILLERGFGDWIGVGSCRWRRLQEVIFAYEEIDEDEPRFYGVSRPRMTAQRCAKRVLEMEAAPGARIRSRIHRPDHGEVFPGSVAFVNRKGGRIVSLAYPMDGGAQFFMGFFNPFRREFLQRILFAIAPAARLAAAGEHPWHLYRAPFAGGTLFAAFNVINDFAGRLLLRLPAAEVVDGQWEVLEADGKWRPVELEQDWEGEWTTFSMPGKVAPLTGCILRRLHGRNTSR
jgi:hypothetical protein